MSAGPTIRRATATADDLIAALVTAGFERSRTGPVQRTVLDSFDGRIDGAGARLVVVSPGRDAPLDLVLTGAPAATLAVAAPPTTAADLPPGPLRSRVAAMLGERVLVPLVDVAGLVTELVRRDDAGKVTVRAAVWRDAAARGAGPQRDAATAHTALGSSVEVSPLLGYDEAFDEALAAIDALCAPTEWSSVEAAAADALLVSLHGFEPAPTVPLTADMRAITGFRAVFRNLVATVETMRPGAAAHLDPEFLHELRVAVRRIRTVSAASRQVAPRDLVDRISDDAKWFGTLTGAARDLDVYQLEWSTYIDGLDATTVDQLEPLRELLAERRQAAHTEVTDGLRGEQAAAILERWRHVVAVGDDDDGQLDGCPWADRPLHKVVVKRTAAAHDRLVSKGRKITASTPDKNVHRLRKDAKNLRYLVECFGGLYGGRERKRFVRTLKHFQDNLGEHQDAAVHAVELTELVADNADRLPVETVLAAGRLIERLDQKRDAARLEFAERFAEFDSNATKRAFAKLLDSAKASSS